MINKQAISVTLHKDNVMWLKGRAEAAGCRSVSDLLDRLVTAARKGNRYSTPKSVIGTIDIDPADPMLKKADQTIRDLFEVSLKGARASSATTSSHRRKPAKTARRA